MNFYFRKINTQLILETQENLSIVQGEVKDIDIEKNKIKGLKLTTGSYFKCKSIVICTGVYLNSKVIIGDNIFDSGPSVHLTHQFLSPDVLLQFLLY